MTTFFRDTAFADLINLVSRGNLFKSHPEAGDHQDIEEFFTKDENTGEILVGWYGEDDPENPYNWSFVYKLWSPG